MSCKPTKLRSGDKIEMQTAGRPYTCFFVRRVPAECRRPAANILFSPDWVGLDGANDKGECVCSDYDLSRKGTVVAV